MMNLKTEITGLASSVPRDMRFCRNKPIGAEEEKQLREHYEPKGWTCESTSDWLSFNSPCGRWFNDYQRKTGRFFYIDGDWTVNLVQTKEKK